MLKEILNNKGRGGLPIIAKGLLALVLLMIMSNGLKAGNKSQDQKIIKEYVRVQQVEIIIRAFRKGRPVSGLKAADLVLYEKGKQMKITSLTEVQRKIGARRVREAGGKKNKAATKKRFFFIYFWLFEPELQYRQALDIFLNDIYQTGDLVYFSLRDQILKIKKKGDIPGVMVRLHKILEQMTKMAKMEINNLALDLEHLCQDYKYAIRAGLVSPARLRERLRQDYESIWKAYKYKHSILNMKQLLAFARALKKVKMEKWGLVFYQNHTFPQLDPMGDTVFIHDKDEEVQELKKMFQGFVIDMNQPFISGPHMREIHEAFISANATFHFLLLGSETKNLFQSTSLKMAEISSDWQVAFRTISKVTGGKTMAGNEIQDFMSKAVQKGDIYYRLTYTPNELDKNKRNIRIKAIQHGIKIFYNRLVDLKPVE